MIKKNITFIASSKEAEKLIEPPVPAYETIPGWYKKSEKYIGGKKEKDTKNNKISNLGVKGCIPFLDTFLTGYVQKSWCDIYIESNENEVKYFSSGIPPVMRHKDLKTQLPIPDEYHKIDFLWNVPWTTKLPKGYSAIYTHPFNRIDLPFQTHTGIIDSDSLFYEKDAAHPFIIKKDFTGIIPMGTPLFMIIPFKRGSWRKKIENFKEKNHKKTISSRTHIEGNYRHNVWKKKDFK